MCLVIRSTPSQNPPGCLGTLLGLGPDGKLLGLIYRTAKLADEAVWVPMDIERWACGRKGRRERCPRREDGARGERGCRALVEKR